LLSMLKGAKFPMAGVVYAGIAGNNLDASRQGLAGDLSVTILVLVQGGSVGGLNEANNATILLDRIRKTILTQRSATGHKWRFVREVPAGAIGNALVYKQTWATAIVLTGD